jgi:hypothetical protein
VSAKNKVIDAPGLHNIPGFDKLTIVECVDRVDLESIFRSNEVCLDVYAAELHEPMGVDRHVLKGVWARNRLFNRLWRVCPVVLREAQDEVAACNVQDVCPMFRVG